MPSDEENLPQERVFFTSEFKRNIRQLARKYRRIKTDIQPIVTALEAGNTPGDRIPGVAVEVYKVRAPNSDSVRGKSGGYRIIYYVTTTNAIILVTMYSKTEQSDISLQEIHDIIAIYEEDQKEANKITTDSEKQLSDNQLDQENREHEEQ